jgi:hypothetical protein
VPAATALERLSARLGLAIYEGPPGAEVKATGNAGRGLVMLIRAGAQVLWVCPAFPCRALVFHTAKCPVASH